MKIRNSTSFRIIAFTWGSIGDHTIGHFGEDTAIEPGNEVDVLGPYLGIMDGEECYLVIPGEIICHEDKDEENRYQILKNNPLRLSDNVFGVEVRHHEDERSPNTTPRKELYLLLNEDLQTDQA